MLINNQIKIKIIQIKDNIWKKLYLIYIYCPKQVKILL